MFLAATPCRLCCMAALRNTGPKILSQKCSSSRMNRLVTISTHRKVVAVPTPRHIPGHISLVVYGYSDDGTQTTDFLPGDGTYGLILWRKRSLIGLTTIR